MTQEEFAKLKTGAVIEIKDQQYAITAVTDTRRGLVVTLEHENGGETTANIQDADSMTIVDESNQPSYGQG